MSALYNSKNFSCTSRTLAPLPAHVMMSTPAPLPLAMVLAPALANCEFGESAEQLIAAVIQLLSTQ